jgi:hypothetical protein
MVNRYQKLITKASEEAIREYDIILCTCSVSAGSRIKRAAKHCSGYCGRMCHVHGAGGAYSAGEL